MMMPNGKMIFVYALPKKMSDGFCFQGGVDIPFKNIDWFEGFDGLTEEQLSDEVSGKIYMQKHRTVLVLSPDAGFCFLLSGDQP